MRKGFQLYSPHQETILFLKAILISFWMGLDAIAILIISTLSSNDLLQRRFLLAVIMTVLILGTLFSLLFVWTRSPLSEKPTAPQEKNRLKKFLQTLKKLPYDLICASIAGTVGAIFIFNMLTEHFKQSPQERIAPKHSISVDAALVKKCTEVAQLEKDLFQSDEQALMAQCLHQYDKKYSELKKLVVQKDSR